MSKIIKGALTVIGVVSVGAVILMAGMDVKNVVEEIVSVKEA